MTNTDSMQVAALVAKLKSGQQLTPAETIRLEQYRQAHRLVDQAGALQILGCSRQQLFEYRKAGLSFQKIKGRVLYSPDALRQWQATHSYTGNLANAATNPGSTSVKVTPAMLDSTPLERLYAMERQAYTDYHAAANIGERRGLLRIHAEVNRAIAEKERTASYITAQQVLWWSEAGQSISKWCEPVKAYLLSAPKTLAQQCNPADPAVAFNALTTWLESTLLPIMTRKPATPTAEVKP